MVTQLLPIALPPRLSSFPPTRFMGSKAKLLPSIHEVVSALEFTTAIDAFSGSGIVSYLFKAMGKRVVANDHMHMCSQFATALIENNDVTLSPAQVERLLADAKGSDKFVQTKFRGLYFAGEDNRAIDNIRANTKQLRNPYARAIATSALIRACMKRRPRGIFTYVGDRYDDGRKDLKKTIAEHFADAVLLFNAAVFNNGRQNQAKTGDVLSLRARGNALIYLDPPYFTPKSDNEYVRRYHFVEGLARNWRGVEIQEHTQTKKFKSYATPFTTRLGALQAFEALFKRFRESIVLVSYSSNAQPNLREIGELLSRYKETVEVVPIRHRYSFGNQGHKVGDNRNAVDEYLFIGT